MKKKIDIKIILSLLLLYFAWGTTYISIHYVVESCPPILASGARNLIAGLLIFIWIFFSKKEAKITRNHLFTMAISGFLMLSMGNGLLTMAGKWVPTGYMSLFPALVPAWIVIIQIILGTKPNLMTIVGLILGFVGIFFLVNQEQLSIKGFEQYFSRGVIFLLLAAIAWSAGVMHSINNPMPYSIAKVSAIQMISGGFISLIFSLLLGEFSAFEPNKITNNAIGGFIYLVFVASILGFLVFTWVSKKASPTLVSTYSYVNPLVAIFIGWLYLGEKLTNNILIAAIFIILAVVLITFGTEKKPN